MRKTKDILVLIVALVATFPIMNWIPNITIISVLSMIMWLVLNAFDNTKMMSKTNVFYHFISIIFLIYVSLVPYLVGNAVIGNRYLDLFSIFFFYIAYRENTSRSNFKSNKKILIIVCSLAIITLIRTIIELINNPLVVRSIKSSDLYTINLLKQGIGGYTFLYFIIFMGVISLGAILAIKQQTKKNSKNRGIINFILLFYVVASTILALLANYLTAIFLLLFGFLLTVFVSLFKFKPNRLVIGGLFLFPFFAIIWKEVSVYVINILVIIIGQGYTSSRLVAFIDYILYGSNLVSITEERSFTRSLSIEAFLDHPLFGLVMTDIQTSSDGYLIGFGQHSYILDTFALFGIVIGFINLYLIIYPFGKRIINGNNVTKLLSLIVLTLTLLFFYINNGASSIGFAIYFLFPMICDYIERYSLE